MKSEDLPVRAPLLLMFGPPRRRLDHPCKTCFAVEETPGGWRVLDYDPDRKALWTRVKATLQAQSGALWTSRRVEIATERELTRLYRLRDGVIIESMYWIDIRRSQTTAV